MHKCGEKKLVSYSYTQYEEKDCILCTLDGLGGKVENRIRLIGSFIIQPMRVVFAVLRTVQTTKKKIQKQKKIHTYKILQSKRMKKFAFVRVYKMTHIHIYRIFFYKKHVYVNPLCR